MQRCEAWRSGAAEQDPFSAVLADQPAVLLHLRLVAGAFAFAGVGRIGHDGPSVQDQGPAHVLQRPSISWTQVGRHQSELIR